MLEKVLEIARACLRHVAHTELDIAAKLHAIGDSVALSDAWKALAVFRCHIGLLVLKDSVSKQRGEIEAL